MIPGRVIDELRHERVTARRYRRHDAAELAQGARESTERVHPWLPWCRPGYGMAEAEQWIESQIGLWDDGRSFEFVLRDPAGGLVGGCGLNQINSEHRLANLGYWLRTGCTGRGYASAAARLLAEFGVREVGLQRIEILAAVGNTASQRVAERAGATREAVLRNRLFLHGRSHDAVVFSFVPEDFPSPPSPDRRSAGYNV